MSIRTSIDIGSLAAALRSPGIDSRMWLTLAIVTDVAFDATHGMLADVKLLSTGDIETVLIGSEYAGDGWGAYFPPKRDDVVLVAVPEGDPGMGPILIKRVWSASAKPPNELHNASSSDAMDASEDPVIVVEPNRTLRIVTRDGASVRFEASGSGTVEINATGAATVSVRAEATVLVESPDVRLGDAPGTPVARVGDLVAVTIPPLLVGPGIAVGSIIVPVPPTGIPGGPISAVGQIVSGAQSVKA